MIFLHIPEGLASHYLRLFDDPAGYPCQAPQLKHDSPLSYKLDIYKLTYIYS